MNRLDLIRAFLPGAVVTAAGVLLLTYKDPLQALAVVSCFGGVFWIGYAALTRVLDGLGMDFSDFFI